VNKNGGKMTEEHIEDINLRDDETQKQIQTLLNYIDTESKKA
jgi:hypothetical protein